MKKISLLLAFAMLLSCLTPCAFAETTEITVGYNENLDKTPGVDTVSVGSEYAAQLEGGEYVIFPVTLEESGSYEVYITALSKAVGGGAVKVQFSPEQSDIVSVTEANGGENAPSSYVKTLARTEVLSKGEHLVRITNTSGINCVKSVSFVKKNDAQSYRLYAPKALNGGAVPSGSGVSVSGTYAWCWEHGTDFVGGTTLTFNLNVETGGKYDLYMSAGSDDANFNININGIEIYSGNWTTENHSIFKKELLTNVVLTEGNTTVSITCQGSDAKVLYLNHLDFLLTSSKLDIVNVMAEGTDLKESSTVPVNADVFEIKFADDIKTSTATTENVKLMCGTDEMPAIITAVGDTIIFALKKTLSASTPYRLIIEGIYDKDGVLSSGECEFLFETVEASSNNASLTLENTSISDGVITATGTVKSSTDVLIEGRKVKLFESGELLNELSYAVTNSSGEYTISYTLPQNTEVGMLNFILKSEYSDALVPFSVLYVTEEAESDFLINLKKQTSSEEAKALFESNEEILSIDVSEDTSGLSEDAVEDIFEGLAGLDAESISQVRKKYFARIAMMQITEATDSDSVMALLSDGDICNSLGINEDMLLDISEYSVSLADAILSMEAANDESVFIEEINDILNNYTLLKYGKSDSGILAEGKTVYLTQECKLTVSASSCISEVKKVILYADSNKKELLDGAVFVATNGAVELSEENGKLKIEITPSLSDIEELGTLKFSSNVSGIFNVVISGEVVYNKELDYELKSKLSEKQVEINVLNELPPETTTDFSADLAVSEGVDVISSGATSVGYIEGSEYIRFPITIDKSGKYEIYVTAMSNSPAGSKIKAQTSAEVTEGVEIPVGNGELTDIALYEQYLVRVEYLSKGNHTVKISNVSGSTAIKSVKALKVEDKEVYRKYAKSTLDMDVPGVNVSGTYAAYYEDGTDIVGGTTISFDVDVENQGFYDLYLTAASAAGANVTATINDNKNISTFWKTPQHIELRKELLGTVSLPSGRSTVAITCVGPDSDIVIVNSIDLILKSNTLDIEAVTSIDTDLTETAAYVSTDVIDVIFNADIKADDVNTENVKLYMNDEEIPIVISAQKNIVSLALEKSLTVNANCRLVLRNIYDESGSISISDYLLPFEVGEGYLQNASVELSDTIMQNENLTIRGTVKSSKGIGISGRGVTLYKAEAPNDEIAEVISANGGEFTLNYNMPQGSTPGMHNFIIKTEYSASDVNFSDIYVTKEQEQTFLEALEDTEDEDDVKTLFAENEDILSINVALDTAGISEKGIETVFEGLVKAEIDTIAKTRAKYYSRIAMVKTSEAVDSDAVLVLLSNSDFAVSLGLDEAMLNDIEDSKESFAVALKEITPKTDEEEYKKLAGELLSEYALKKYSKSNANILADNKAIYEGQIALVDISSETELTDVSTVVLTISSSAGVISGAEFEGAEGVTAKTSKESESMTVTLTAESIKKLGTLKLSGNGMGSYTIKISGKVVYDKALSYELASMLNEKTITLSVQKNTNKGTGSSGSGGSINGVKSGSLGSAIIPETVVKFEFTDIENYTWAEESIKYLLANGIISESEDGKFRPGDSVTREEFVKMIVLALGVYDSTAISQLSDVKKDSWYYQYVASAQKVGLVYGNDKGNFGVGENITRQDMAVIINRALTLIGFTDDGDNDAMFADDNQISDYAKSAVYYMKKLGLINGMGDNMFAPKLSATRAQTSKMIFGMMKAVGK